MIKKNMAAIVGVLLWLAATPAPGKSVNFGPGDGYSNGSNTQSTVKFWNAPGNGSDYLMILPHTNNSLPVLISEFDLTSDLTTSNAYLYCKNGGAIDSLRMLSSDSSLMNISSQHGIDGERLLKTSVTGLYFSLGITNPRTSSHADMFVDADKKYYFPIPNGDLWRINEQISGCATNVVWQSPAEVGRFSITSHLRFYVDNTYNPVPTQQLSGTFAFRLAIESDNNVAEIRESFAGFTVAPPTCLTSAVTSTEAGALSGDGSGMRYTLNLGNHSPAEVRSGQAKKVPFTVKLGQCAAVDTLKVSVSGRAAINNIIYFANTSGSAKNAAVKLNYIDGNTEQLFPPNSPLPNRTGGIDAGRGALGPSLINRFTGDPVVGSGTPGEFTLEFNAQLVAENAINPVTPGSVNALSTLLFEYP